MIVSTQTREQENHVFCYLDNLFSILINNKDGHFFISPNDVAYILGNDPCPLGKLLEKLCVGDEIVKRQRKYIFVI